MGGAPLLDAMVMPAVHDHTRATAGRRPARYDVDVLIVGPVPPPFGGISVHLSRFLPLVARAGIEVAVLNHFGSTGQPFVVGALNKSPIAYYRRLVASRAAVVHYHHARWVQLLAVALAASRRPDARWVLTLHANDVGAQLRSRLPLLPATTRWALSRFDVIVVVDAATAAELRSRGGVGAIETIPAFLPAARNEAGAYDDDLEAFLGGGTLLVLAAYGVQFLRDGRELYGIDTAVRTFVALARGRDDLRLAIFLAKRPKGGRAARHLAQVEALLAREELAERTRVLYGLPFDPALRSNATMIRPTRSEGDAVSVREALRAGVPVVASDVVERPDGVTSVHVDDVEGYVQALGPLLDRPRGVDDRPEFDAGSERFADALIDLYRRQLEIACSR